MPEGSKPEQDDDTWGTVTPGLLGHAEPVGTTPSSLEPSSLEHSPVPAPQPPAEDWLALGYTPPSGISLTKLSAGAPGYRCIRRMSSC